MRAMNTRPLLILLASFAGVACASEALMPTDDALLNTGHHVYISHCAVCHGDRGQGDGPFASLLETRPPDLTRIGERAHGFFPLWRVYDTISGSELLPAHGTREMPIWGAIFAIEAGNTNLDTATYTRGRIFSLVAWLNSIQETAPAAPTDQHKE